MCFIETLVIAHTVSDILVQIDHKCPNWTFLTLKITFRVIQRLSYFRIRLVSHQRRYLVHDEITLGSTSLPLNNINNYGKMGQT